MILAEVHEGISEIITINFVAAVSEQNELQMTVVE